MGTLKLLSGGAAQALVEQLRPALLAETSLSIEAGFGAVGAMRDRLLGGDPCDVVILTQALIDQLGSDGHVVTGSGVALGVVRTGVAVQAGAAHPDVSTAEALKRVLLGASGVYFPDPVKATAGIHFMKVLKTLGVDGELAGRMHTFANGAAAMHAMTQDGDERAIGCTQVTEILFAPGVDLAGLLPKEFELATVYTAGVCTAAKESKGATRFIGMMASPDAAGLRRECGFETQ